MTTSDALFLVLGYVMVVFGMFVVDFRKTFNEDDSKIYLCRIFVESGVLYLVYYLFLKDTILNTNVSIFNIVLTFSEKTSLGVNLMIGITGYDRIMKYVTKKFNKKLKGD